MLQTRAAIRCQVRAVPTLRTVYCQDRYADSDGHRAVLDISDQLLGRLKTDAALELMHHANMPGVSSAEVQATFLPFALDLGFTSGARGLFREYDNKLRPDYRRPVAGSGILLEVEWCRRRCATTPR